MSRRKSHLSRCSKNARRMRLQRRKKLEDEKMNRLIREQIINQQNCLKESSDEHLQHLAKQTSHITANHVQESSTECSWHLEQQYTKAQRQTNSLNSAFAYDSSMDYSVLNDVNISRINLIYNNCDTQKWRNEAPGLCCSKDKEAMAESSAISKPLVADRPLKNVLDCSNLDTSFQKHLSTCKSVPICLEEESSTALTSICPNPNDKGKHSPDSSLIYSLGANQCFHCLITFPDEKFKERHMKREHPEDFVQANLHDALFVCFTCNNTFKSSRALIYHQRCHTPVPPSDCARPTFDCPDCGCRFEQLASYQSHRLGHAAGHSLPHQCPDCGKSFRQLSNLRRHQAFHQQTQELMPSHPYSCTECEKGFNQEAELHEHYIRHARGELEHWLPLYEEFPRFSVQAGR